MSKIPVFLLSIYCSLFSTELIAAVSMADYTCYPTFTAQSIKPNILIILDNSGGMNLQAYSEAFNPSIQYYGYFDPTSRYTYTNNRFERNTAGAWDGNFLNWLTMRRVDIARKVLVGGKAESRTGGGVQVTVGEDPTQTGREYFKTYANSASYSPYDSTYMFLMDDGMIYIYKWSGSDWVDQKISYTIKVKKEATFEPQDFGPDGNLAGVMQRISSKARFGLEFFNRGNGIEDGYDKKYDGGNIRSSIGSNMTSMITNIENMSCDTWTPLAESFYEGMRYFQQVAPYYSTGDYVVNRNNDPYYFSDQAGYVPCAKSFVLMITDGESTKDLNIPSVYRDYDNDGSDPGTYSDNGSDYLDDCALWAHTNDIRPDLNGTQKIALYTVFAFGSGSQLLKDAARNGGFIDKNGNNLPDQESEWDEDGDGLPDTYFEAQDGYELEVKLLAAITDILKRAASGTAASVLATSGEGEGSLSQAFFRPSVFDDLREIRWLGYLLYLWVDPKGNLREDTDGDKRLTYTHDKIIKYIFSESTGETTINLYSDNNGDGDADSETPDSTITLDQLHPLWEAGKLLALEQPAERSIYTFVDGNKNNIVDSGEYIPFTTSNVSTLRPFLRATDTTQATNIIDFIRGSTVTGSRDRLLTIEGQDTVWKFGDVVYSSPTVMSKPMNDYGLIYGDASFESFYNTYKNRDAVIFVGGNDGMLHAFNAGTFSEGDNSTTPDIEHGWYSGTNLGSELWCYIPYNLLPHLKWFTQNDYTHVYYVDLKPRIFDAKIFSPDETHPSGWGSVLIGGMRLGGGPISVTDNFGIGSETRTFRSAYFAIDVTNPTSPQLLWEFTDANLGATLSYPTVAKVGNSWFLLFGSGPTTFCSVESNQTSRLYVLNLKTGQLLKTFTGGTNAFMASPISVDVLINYHVDVCYLGENYYESGTWKGRIYRLSTKICNAGCENPDNWQYSENPNTWTFSTFFEFDRPITDPPAVSLDDMGKLWIYFGTGRYYSESDKSDTTSQKFYGIKDPCYNGNCTTTVSNSNLFDASLATVAVGGSVSGITGVTNWETLLGTVKGKDGWYLNLTTSGERSLTKPAVFGGIVLFTTFIPNSALCSFGGSGKLYALYYTTGTAYKKSVIGTSGTTVLKSKDLGYGVPSGISIHVGQEEGGRGYVQQSTGTISEVEVTPTVRVKSGTISWMEK